MVTPSKSAGTSNSSGSEAKTDTTAAAAAGRTPVPETRKKPAFGLSFCTRTTTARGRHISSNYFDLPAESYADGWITGMRAAAELMRALKNKDACVPLLAILQEAGVVMRNDMGVLSRYGAAVGFLRMLEPMLHFASSHAKHQEFIEGSIQRYSETRALCEEDSLKSKAEKVERLRAGRAKAKAAREAANV